MMGNRGIIHDPHTRALLSRRWQHQAWICCVLEFKDYQHPIMGVGHYTELFFLDEATAFAAGHRPCAYCRRSDFNAFKRAWADAKALIPAEVRAPTIDHRLHRERTSRDRVQITYMAALDDVPDGTLVRLDDQPQAYLVHESRLLRWSPRGYELALERSAGMTVAVLTPRSAVAAFACGYRARVHPSASRLTGVAHSQEALFH
jgi:hypothetical protein